MARCLYGLVTVLALAVGSFAAAPDSVETISEIAQKSKTLVPFVFEPLPHGSVKPRGWLQDQLGLMRDGLAGHEHDFYGYVADSSWLGGGWEYSDLNEGFPYWFNGLVPLAYALNDARLKDQVHTSAHYVLTTTTWKDGWIGPESPPNRVFWARYPLCLGLVQLAEANSTWTKPVVKALQKFSGLMHTMLKNGYQGYIYTPGSFINQGDFQWGQARAQDMMITLQWLYENYPGGNQAQLMDNMNMLYAESFKWEAYYNEHTYLFQDLWTVSDDVWNPLFPYLHGVNVAQGLKAPAVVRRFTHNDSLINTAYLGVNWTFTYHGASSGTVIADEREDGISPYSGAELCTSVEAMYSLTYLYQALGDRYYADRAEITAFNSLAAMVTPDWWARQYMQAANQPNAVNFNQTPYWNVQTWGSTFGLEPDYPCCTVNHPQGWPKWLSASFTRVGDTGLAHALLGPGTVTAVLSPGTVTIDCETNYPFTDDLFYTITATVGFDFYVRVPSWAESDSTIAIGKAKAKSLTPDPVSGLQQLTIPPGTTTITYHLSRSPVTTPRANDTVAVYHGPLLYALYIESSNSSTLPRRYYDWQEYPAGYAPPQSRDWIISNESAWAVAIDPSTLAFHSTAKASTTPLANPIFAPLAPPTYMTVLACEIDWPLYLNSVPDDPIPLAQRQCLGGTFNATLVPYASAKLHMSELPTIKLV